MQYLIRTILRIIHEEIACAGTQLGNVERETGSNHEVTEECVGIREADLTLIPIMRPESIARQPCNDLPLMLRFEPIECPI